MMPTDTLTCQVTPDSVEPHSLSCSIPPLEWLDLWTLLGAWATALFTLGLLIGAVIAARIAYQNLKELQRQTMIASETSRTTVELAKEERQFRALIDYQESWTSINSRNFSDWQDIDEPMGVAITKGRVWRAMHWADRVDLGQMQDLEREIFRAVGKAAHHCRGKYSASSYVDHGISEAIHELTTAAIEWQHALPADRHAVLRQVSDSIKKVKKASKFEKEEE